MSPVNGRDDEEMRRPEQKGGEGKKGRSEGKAGGGRNRRRLKETRWQNEGIEITPKYTI